MKLKKYIIGAASTSLIAILGTAAQATTLESTNFGTLVHDADACVVATVSDVSYVQEDGQAFTMTSFDVTDVAFGNVSNTFTVKTPGGRLVSAPIAVSETVAGMPRFFADSSYLLVLDSDGQDFAISGLFQGAIPVVNNSVIMPENRGILDVDSALDAVNDIRRTPASRQR